MTKFIQLYNTVQKFDELENVLIHTLNDGAKEITEEEYFSLKREKDSKLEAEIRSLLSKKIFSINGKGVYFTPDMEVYADLLKRIEGGEYENDNTFFGSEKEAEAAGYTRYQ